MENIEPATAEQSFAAGKRTKTIKQRPIFIRPSFHPSCCSQAKNQESLEE
jgi:hypothetical protein